jgi:hypothetical protein
MRSRQVYLHSLSADGGFAVGKLEALVIWTQIEPKVWVSANDTSKIADAVGILVCPARSKVGPSAPLHYFLPAASACGADVKHAIGSAATV